MIASSADMDNAIGILASAHRPVVIGGRDAHDEQTQAAIRRLAEHIQAPLATSVHGKGLSPMIRSTSASAKR